MKGYRNFLSATLAVITLCMSLAVPASAAEVPAAQDASAQSSWSEAIAYMTEKGIASDVADDCFLPNENITARQWAVMVCRAYGKEVAPGAAFGSAEMKLAYKEGWLDLGAMIDPDSAMCRRYAYESIFQVAGIPVFDAELYAEKATSYEDRYVRVAKENALCEGADGELDLITRGEAAYIIYMMQTKDIAVEVPELMQMINVINVDQNFNLNAYLLEIQKIPANILKQFNEDGWSYRVDSEAVTAFGDHKGMEYAGFCSYENKNICVKYNYATVHEFGHYYYAVCDKAGFSAVYEKEAKAASEVLGDYAATNANEYFAEAFDYWINWSDNSDQMKVLQETAPETYEFFRGLEANNWN